jgi:outer membrane protein
MQSRIIAVAALALACVAAHAQIHQSLTVEEAVAIGTTNSKVLRQSESRVLSADARASEVAASALPSLKFGGSYTRLSQVPPFAFDNPFPTGPSKIVLAPTVLDNYNLKLTLQHPLFVGFKLDAAKDAADANSEATAQDFVRDRADLVVNITTAYWNLFRTREFKKLADENVDQIASHVSDVKNLMDQGLATRNDQLATEVQLSDAQLRQIDAANNARLALIALDNTLGIPLSTDIDIATDITHTPRRFAPLDSLIQRAIDARPELKGMRSRVKAGEAGVTSAHAGWWPQIYLTGNYYYARPNQRIQPTVDAFKDTWDLGVGVSLDIWNWGTTVHQTDQAQAQLAQTRDAFDQMRDGVTLDVTGAYLTLQQAGERISVARTGLSRAEENYRVTGRRFREGLVTNSEMLDAQFAQNQAKTTYTQSLVDFELAQARLARAIGE